MIFHHKEKVRQQPFHYSADILVPLTLSGTVLASHEVLSNGYDSDYRLICDGGVEYYIVADLEWHAILASHVGQTIVIGALANLPTRTLFPKSVIEGQFNADHDHSEVLHPGVESPFKWPFGNEWRIE